MFWGAGVSFRGEETLRSILKFAYFHHEKGIEIGYPCRKTSLCEDIQTQKCKDMIKGNEDIVGNQTILCMGEQ